jgi:ATP-dependent Clp protease ATP-binding subunit ClpA
MKTKSINRSGKHHGNGVISDDAGSALARLFSSAAECGDAISCAKRIEAGAQLREAKERKREKNREARSRKKAARPIAKAIAARNWALNGDAEEGDVAPEYREFLNHLLHTMFGCEKRDNTLPLRIPIRIAEETIKVSAGEHAPIFRTALRLLIAEDKRSIVSKWTGVPLHRMEQKEAQKLLKMEEELKEQVIGQDEAVIAISKALRRSRADLKDPRRPIGSFVFMGPTGVGKTFLARSLAEFMFGDADSLIQSTCPNTRRSSPRRA